MLLTVACWLTPLVRIPCLAAPPTDTDPRPNILLAISDDQSYPHASAYGYPAVDTPAFDRIAREGVLFTSAFAASPGCSPSRAALLTGRYPWQNEHAGTHASSFSSKFAVYPELLGQNGYHVGHTGKGWGPGNAREGGFSQNPAGTDYRVMSTESPPGISRVDYAASFARFLDERPPGTPFCFWYGATEPHRSFGNGIGRQHAGRAEDVVVPSFLPDHPAVRDDLLDYSYEIEWFDRHLGRMLRLLEQQGELNNTIVVVTSDNGMAFPRAKANCYEYGIHMPLAIRWGGQAPAGRVVDDLVSLIDLAPTFLEACGVAHPGPFPMTGRSLLSILTSQRSGLVDDQRTAVFAARERHSSSRWHNLGYPQRCLRTADFLYIRNFRAERWPAGAPQKFGYGSYARRQDEQQLGPMHQAYHDIDSCPTLSLLTENADDVALGGFLHLAVGHRPAEELYDIRQDPGCLENLADSPSHAEVLGKLATQLETFLRQTGDPRVCDDDGGEVFETYRRYSRLRTFPAPDWARPEAGPGDPPPPWRFAARMHEFARTDIRQPPPPGVVAFVGSSSVRRWPLAQFFPGVPVLNRGFGGSWTADVAWYAHRVVTPYQPETVVVYAGDNDIGHGRSPEQVAGDFQRFVRNVRRQRPSSSIVFLAIKPSLKRWAFVEQIRAANRAIREICDQDQSLHFADIFTPMLGEDGRPKADLLAGDGLHPSEEGYRLWASVVRPFLGR
jgi:uncharacterized sulfatase